MLVKCQNCSATYKIDEKKIPKDKKTVIHCYSCKYEIVLTQGNIDKTKAHIIDTECSKCGAYYGIPIHHFKTDSIKVKCGKCEQYFVVSKLKNDLFDDDIVEEQERKIKLDKIDGHSLENIQRMTSIEKANEINVDNIFEEFQEPNIQGEINEEKVKSKKIDIEELTDKKTDSLPRTKVAPIKQSEKEYLNSIELEEQIEENFAFDTGSIPEDQKYQFFLNPKDKVLKNKNIEENEIISKIDLEKAEQIEELKEKKQKIMMVLTALLFGGVVGLSSYIYRESILSLLGF